MPEIGLLGASAGVGGVMSTSRGMLSTIAVHWECVISRTYEAFAPLHQLVSKRGNRCTLYIGSKIAMTKQAKKNQL